MIGCLRTRVGKQPIITFYFEFENDLSFITPRPGRGRSSITYYDLLINAQIICVCRIANSGYPDEIPHLR